MSLTKYKKVVETFQSTSDIDLASIVENKDYAEIRDVSTSCAEIFVNLYLDDIKMDMKGHNGVNQVCFKNDIELRTYYISLVKRVIAKSISLYIIFNFDKKSSFDENDASKVDDLNTLNELYIIHYSCEICGESMPLYFNFHAMEVKINQELSDSEYCSMLNVDKVYSIELDFSCGQILVANDMRRLLGTEEKIDKLEEEFLKKKGNNESYISSNHRRGRMLRTEFSAEQGLMYFQSGNNSPSYYQNVDANYIVFRSSFDEAKNADLEALPFKIDMDKEKPLGYVCTDLWAVQAMSMDTFKRLCHENGLNEEDIIKELNIEIHDIPKGIYKCTTYYELIEDYGQNLYHTIELISGE